MLDECLTLCAREIHVYVLPSLNCPTEATAGRFSLGSVLARCSFDDTTIGSPDTTCDYIEQYAGADRPFQYAESTTRGDTGPNAGYNAFGTYHSDQAGAGARGGVGVKINQSMIV